MDSGTDPAPADLGFAPDVARKLAAGIESGLLRGLHTVLASRNGSLALEYYGAGPDENWGAPLGDRCFDRQSLHDLRSVTKSIAGLLYGIALDRGLVPAPEAPLLQQFPEYPDLGKDPQRASLCIAHALSMTLGMAWDEDRPYTDPENSEIAMESAPDRLRFVLDRPIVAAPGTRWTYSGGAVALLGALIARGTGQSLPDFARDTLFAPLGIGAFEWSAGRDGTASAASGLRLTAPDLLKIGTMLLAGGEWQGRRIVNRDWIDASWAPAIPTGDGLDYGRLWFLGSAPVPALEGEGRWVAGFGNGGQRLWLLPDAGIAAVIFSGRYNAMDAWVTPTRVWREILLANFLKT
jgi:CubicO group peptidase (beta-lactamase class C family)